MTRVQGILQKVNKLRVLWVLLGLVTREVLADEEALAPEKVVSIEAVVEVQEGEESGEGISEHA